MENRPKIGIGVIIERGGRILLGQRKNAHGDGDWSFPGGHLEFGESWEACAAREAKEETGLDISGASFAAATNDIFEAEGKHYVTIFLRAEAPSGEPAVLEPEKCAQWRWFGWDELPEPLFLPIRNLLADGRAHGLRQEE
jgi:8-oxo-dGTP diphosphatase